MYVYLLDTRAGSLVMMMIVCIVCVYTKAVCDHHDRERRIRLPRSLVDYLGFLSSHIIPLHSTAIVQCPSSMSESRAVAYPRQVRISSKAMVQLDNLCSLLLQRRIRHIKSLAGRNIAATHEDEAFLSTDNGDVDIVSTFVVASRSSSAVTSRASSPSAQWDNTPSRSKSTALHRRTGSVEPPPPHLLPATTMRRSESSSSISSTTVEDSSMTKSAYKKKQRRPESMISTTAACPVINNSNNTYGKGLLDCYYTLHLSAEEMPFYRSEIIPNTIDPTFRVLDTSQGSSWYDGVQTEVVVRLWARHSFPESATQTGEQHHDATNKAADDQDFELVIEWHVDLNALSWIGKVVSSFKHHPRDSKVELTSFFFQLQDIPGAFPENTLLFELDDGFYTAPNIVVCMLSGVCDMKYTYFGIPIVQALGPKQTIEFSRAL